MQCIRNVLTIGTQMAKDGWNTVAQSSFARTSGHWTVTAGKVVGMVAGAAASPFLFSFGFLVGVLYPAFGQEQFDKLEAVWLKQGPWTRFFFAIGAMWRLDQTLATAALATGVWIGKYLSTDALAERAGASRYGLMPNAN